MRIKRNGFTLIELLAVIVILGILIMMAIPNVMSVFSDKKEILYNTTISEIERFAGVYMTENPDLYNTIANNGYVDITTDVLCSEKFLSCPINDPRDSSVITGYVRVLIIDNDYVYNFTRN